MAYCRKWWEQSLRQLVRSQIHWSNKQFNWLQKRLASEYKNEQLTEKVIKVLKECDPTMSEADISVCHRSGPFNMRGGGRDGKRPVLCRFVARVRKTNVMLGKKQLKAKHRCTKY